MGTKHFLAEIASRLILKLGSGDPELQPFTWYKRHVIEGAREADLPSAYIKTIENVAATEDDDKQRETQELAIYG